MKANIDNIAPSRGLIDLDSHSGGDSPLLEDYCLDKIYDDIILVIPLDESPDGDAILKNGIYVPKNAVTQAWRIGKVVLKGPSAKNVKVGETVIFPNDRGLTVKNIQVTGHKEKIRSGVFLNQERLFGSCHLVTTDESKSTGS